ncbi:hypothetical protein BKI52_02590 [marine bacterium AO1-C]|nr:hypothetical protein BKI52_02590 [marine bacterium AO1-C]
MKPMNEKDKIFKTGGAVKMIDWFFADLPNIAITISTGLRCALGSIIFLHLMDLLKFINPPALRFIIVLVFTLGLEAALLSSSLVSAKLRRMAMKGWAWFYFFFTVVGSVLFNGFFLYQSTKSTDNVYLQHVSDDNRLSVLLVLEFVNVVAIIMAEAAAFLLNAGEKHADILKENQQLKKQNNRLEHQLSSTKESHKVTTPKTAIIKPKTVLKTEFERQLLVAIAATEKGKLLFGDGKEIVSWFVKDLPDLIPESEYIAAIEKAERFAISRLPDFRFPLPEVEPELKTTPKPEPIAEKAETLNSIPEDLEERVGSITPDILQVLVKLGEGKKQKIIANEIDRSERTIRDWLVRAADKLNYENGKELKKDIHKIAPIAANKLKDYETTTV